MVGKDCCRICRQIEGERNDDLLWPIVGGDAYERVIAWEDDDFVLFPSIGALSVGHVLLSPKRHARSFALVGRDSATSVGPVVNDVKSAVMTAFGRPVHIFEHGNSDSGERTVCTVDHAHLHFVPADVEVWGELQRLFPWTSFEGALNQLHVQTGGREYLLYISPAGQVHLSVGCGEYQSQVLRKVFAETLCTGRPHDWKQCPADDIVRETWAGLKSLVGRGSLVGAA